MASALAPYSSSIIEREGNDPICVEVIGAGSAEYVHGLRDFNDSGESRRWAFDSSDAVLLGIHKTVVEQMKARLGVHTTSGVIYDLSRVRSRIANVLGERTDVNYAPHSGVSLDENWRLEYARLYLGDVLLPRGSVARAIAAADELGELIASGTHATVVDVSRIVNEVASLPGDRDAVESAQLLESIQRRASRGACPGCGMGRLGYQ